MHKLLIIIAALAATACSPTVASPDEEAAGEQPVFETTDLSLFELRHRVKSATKTTYYRATPDGDSVNIDTAASHVAVSVAYFDTLGNYVTRQDERLRRDQWGRIIRWEDRRPNHGRLSGGFLKDTLSYRHLSANVVETSGMGDFAVTVYDNDRRIVGQYTDPLVDGDHTAVFNLYREADSLGNWTERLSVWTTQSTGRRPHISYTLERRKIVYW